MKKVKVTQIKSSIGKERSQKRTLESLGLGRIGKSREHSATPQIAGMIKKVDFCIKVEEVK